MIVIFDFIVELPLGIALGVARVRMYSEVRGQNVKQVRLTTTAFILELITSIPLGYKV